MSEVNSNRSQHVPVRLPSPFTVNAELGAGSSAEIRAGLNTQEAFFLGVDGGGTKTRAAVIDSEGSVRGEGLSGGSNPVRVELEEAVSNVRTAVEQACVAAGVELNRITAACIAIAGITHPDHFGPMLKAVTRTLDIEEIQLVTDARAALNGGLNGGSGVVVIAGTGSIAIGINVAGEEARSGGWGPTISDEGSGYEIARQALRAVAASQDGRSTMTVLTEKVFKRLGISSMPELPGVIYHEGSGADPVEVARLAEVVSEAARDGDQTARAILANAGRELAKLAGSVIKQLGLQNESFRVACVGGVFNAGKYLFEPFRQAVLEAAPHAQIGPPVFEPVIGAARLARVKTAISGPVKMK